MRKPVIKIRKPRRYFGNAAWFYSENKSVYLDPTIMRKPEEIRKLAMWLIKCSLWLDHQESVKKKRGS